MPTLSEWALSYHELGWPVVPISADKKPLVKWRKYQTEPQTPAEIEQWWKDFPTAGIAIITGEISGLIVLDADDETAIAKVAELGITSTVTCTTNRGRHYLFAHPGYKVKNRTGWKGHDKIDLRGDGGLFKVYPSRGYMWDLPIGVKVSDIPHELSTWEFDESPETSTDMLDLSDVKADIPDHIDEGGRNDAMTRVVGKLIKDDPALWGRNLVIEAWAENMKRCAPPLSQDEIKIIVKSVMEMHQRNNPDEFNEDGKRKESLLSDLERLVKANRRLMFEWDSIGLTGEPPEREWLVENIIPAGLPGVLASPGGVGKTFLLLDLALKVACPYPDRVGTFLGHPVTKTGTVVMFLAEDDRHEIMRRLEALDPYYARIFYPEKLVVISVPELPQSISLGTKLYDLPKLTKEAEGWYATLTQIDDLALVVFDPLQSFFDWRFDEDNVAADRAMKWAQSIAVHTGAAFIYTHHLRKEDMGTSPSTPQVAVNKIRGASNVVNSARFAIPIWRPTEEVHDEVAAKLGITENNAVFMAGLGKENFGGDVSTHWLVRDPETGLLIDRTHDVGASSGSPRESAKGVPSIERVVAVLMKSEESLSRDEIHKSSGVAKGYISPSLKKLMASGHIYKEARGKYRHCRSHPHFDKVCGMVTDQIKSSLSPDEGLPMADLMRAMRSAHKKLLFREATRSLIDHGVVKMVRVPNQKTGSIKRYLKLQPEGQPIEAETDASD